ncbi:MAG: 50S ribosomal protein L23 [Chthonomonadales bacterium]
MRDPYLIIERPMLSEKAMDLGADGKYTFRVSKESNKIEIALAVEMIFKLEPGTVTKVNTISVKGKKKRVGRAPEGRTTDWKKAIVTLKPGEAITLFEGI